MPNENTFTHGVNPLCQNDHLWSANDEQGSETEVNEFLFALIRLLKPQFVVETGCYFGDGTIAMAMALRQNNIGKLMTCDIDPDKVVGTEKRIKEEGYQDIVSVALVKGIDIIKGTGSLIDFAFIDSGSAQVRGEEIEALLTVVKPGTMFALHDTAPQHVGLHELSNRLNLKKLYFNCPRGLTLFVK